MKKTSLTQALFVAGVVAAAGAAHAAGMTHGELRSDLGADTSLSSQSALDTSVLGAGSSSVTTTTTTTHPQLVYVQPSIDWDRGTAMSQMRSNAHLHGNVQSRSTFDVPQRAGEASTMTGGAPNLVTNNAPVVAPSPNGPIAANTQTRSTFDLPQRAGEASTMTGGVPNMVTDNERMVIGSYSIPHSAVTGDYYVFSW